MDLLRPKSIRVRMAMWAGTPTRRVRTQAPVPSRFPAQPHTATDCGVWLNRGMDTITAPANPPATSSRGARLSAADWAQAALDVIAEQGVSAVAVEPLARRLGVTKGSFYWHFPSRDALLQAALERWE